MVYCYVGFNKADGGRPPAIIVSSMAWMRGTRPAHLLSAADVARIFTPPPYIPACSQKMFFFLQAADIDVVGAESERGG